MKKISQLLLLLINIGLLKCKSNPPHIVILYADDLGWNDVSYHGSFEIPTPNIDALAMSGITLHNYYGYCLCTPNRAALMSGRNPIRLGLQHLVILAGERSGLPLHITTLPQYLKRLGYTNHMIGKWHLGYMTKQYLPTHRGFDTHFGYWNGQMDHFDYTYFDGTFLEAAPFFNGIDLHNGTDTITNIRGKYATDMFTELAEDRIKNHDSSKPLFLFFSHQVPHTGNIYDPLQAAPHYVKRVKHIKDVRRRKYAANVVALDDSVGRVVNALHKKGMLENSIIAFASDNGGETLREIGGLASNYPLRGKKFTLWEGGVRVPALIWSPLFNLQTPRISSQLMQVTDWLPTLYEAAGGNLNDLRNIDGVSMWEAFLKDEPSPRTNLLYNIDPILGNAAVRVGHMKLITGPNYYDGWYNPPTNDNVICDQCAEYGSIVRRILLETGRWIMKNPNEWRNKLTVKCSEPPPVKSGNCIPEKKPCLFNLAEDPCEYNDIADQYPQEVEELLKLIEEYQKTAITPQSKPSDPDANPLCHNFSYVPWRDPEHYHKCDEYL